MFIYVMDERDKNLLESMGYELLKSNGKVWVFVNKEGLQFDSMSVPCVVSDVLTF